MKNQNHRGSDHCAPRPSPDLKIGAQPYPPTMLQLRGQELEEPQSPPAKLGSRSRFRKITTVADSSSGSRSGGGDTRLRHCARSSELSLNNSAAWDRLENTLLTLAQRFSDQAQSRGIVLVTTVGWHDRGNGRFVYGPSLSYWVDQSLVSEYTSWPLYANLVDASSCSPLIEHLNELIGGSGIRTRVDLQTFVLGTLSRAIQTSVTGVTLAEDVVKRRVADLKALCINDEIENETLVLVGGVISEELYDLGFDVCIQPLDSAAMTSFISSGAVPVTFRAGEEPSITIPPSEWVALRRSIREIKTTSKSCRDARLRMSPDITARADFEAFADALAVINGTCPRFLGWRSQLSNNVLQTAWQSGHGGDLSEGSSASRIAADDRLRVVWTAIKSTRDNPSLALPVRRLRFAAVRDQWEDRLLDLMIALEALLLRDQQGDRNELRFRAAIRAAHWWTPGSLNLSPAQVYDIVRRAYDYRSTLSHGGVVDEAKLVLVAGERYTYERVVGATHGIACALMEKALRVLLREKRYSIPWDAMLQDHLDALDNGVDPV